jgi:tetratricopeptide (TPR) repeat protein
MIRQLNTVWLLAVVLLSPQWSPAADIDNPPPAASPTPSPEVAELVAKGRKLRNAGDFVGGRTAFDEALAKGRSIKDSAGESLALNNIASIYRYEAGLAKITANQNPPLDLIDKSTDVYEQALRAARKARDKTDEAYATLYLGVLAAGRGDPDRAFNYYFDALEMYKALGDAYYHARTLMFMGTTTLYHRQRPDASLKYFEQALPLFREVNYWHEAQWVISDMNVAYSQLMAQANGQR